MIDGDSIIYRSAFAVEKNLSLAVRDGREVLGTFDGKRAANAAMEAAGPDIRLWHRKEVGSVAEMQKIMANIVLSILGRYPNASWVGFLSNPDDRNFRRDIAKSNPYKGNRRERPDLYKEARAYATETFGFSYAASDWEVDDEVCFTAGFYRTMGHTPIICSIDKDLDQIPGKHWNWSKNLEYIVTPEEAELNLLKQILTGDAGDNIAGIDGIGPVKADNLLRRLPDGSARWKEIVEIYEEEYGANGRERALEVANLVYLRTLPTRGFPAGEYERVAGPEGLQDNPRVEEVRND